MDDLRARVPVRSYEELRPWIDRVRNGEPNVLTAGPVTRLVPTGGSAGGRKLIPYTRAVQAEWNRAIGPWIVDLFHQYPTLLGGPAYWSVSPVAQAADAEPSAVPIGFDDDAAYLGGLRRRLVDAVMAVPASVQHAATLDEWRRQTLGHLLGCRGLRLASVWHPSFLTLLLGEARPTWPKLRLISCWADGPAALAAAALADRFPGAVVQPKGILATEGIVSVPFRGGWPLAVRSHLLEFLDGDRVFSAHELTPGQTAEVVLTTGGGLCRYRLGDLVRVDGFVGRTPSVRFVGRAGNVSDRFGEKLDEPFVAGVVDRLRQPTWRFAMLAPDGPRYALYVDGDVSVGLADRLDAELRRNPHYGYCRDLGQLGAATVVEVSGGSEGYLRRLAASGQRIGDVKPSALSRLEGWGAFLDARRQSRP